MKLQELLLGPSPRTKARRIAALWSSAIALLAALALWPVAQRIDLWLFDREVELVRALRDPARAPATPEVAIVGIDDASLAMIGGPLPLTLIHAELGAALEAIAAVQPRAIGVDLVLTRESVESLRPGHDFALMRGLIAARQSGGVALVFTHQADGQLVLPFAAYVAAAGTDALGIALFPHDADNVVRRFEPDIAGDRPTLLERIAVRLGVSERVRPGWIDFTRGAAFDYVPLHRVTQWWRSGDRASLQAALAGRVVLIGSVLPYEDRHSAPVTLAAWPGEVEGAPMPGVLLQAQALRTVFGAGFVQPAPAAAPWLLAALALALAWVPAMVVRWSTLVAALLATFAIAAAWHSAGTYLPLAGAWLAAFIAVATRTSADVMLARRDRQRLARTFGGYVSPQLLRAILSGRIGIGPGRRAMAFLFADLRGFTQWSERTEPEVVLNVLNAYYSAITPIIHRHGGTIDNFRGDGVMVMFGAPETHAAPCDAAFAAGREMLDAVRQLNAGEAGARGLTIDVSMGLAWGVAVFGDLGSSERKDFTALGDAVNVAARLQELAKTLGFPILMTMTFVEQLSPATRSRYTPELQGEAPLKGHSPVSVAGWPAHQPAAAAVSINPPEYSRAEASQQT
jgi:class 3 adenylate cyclase